MQAPQVTQNNSPGHFIELLQYAQFVQKSLISVACFTFIFKYKTLLNEYYVLSNFNKF